MTGLTENAIKAMTLDYNAGYDGVDEFVASGRAFVQVAASTDSSGWNMRLVVAPVVRGADGGTAFGAEPTVFNWRALRRTERLSDAAKRAAKKAFPGAQVPTRVLINSKEVEA